MKNKIIILSTVLLASLMGCSSSPSSSQTTTTTSQVTSTSAPSTTSEFDPSFTIDYAGQRETYGSFAITCDDPSSYKLDVATNTYTFSPTSEKTVYELTGYFKGKLVNTVKNTEFKLNHCFIENDQGAAIYGQLKTCISTVKQTINYVVSEGGSDKAAILCEKAIEFGGSGVIKVVGKVSHAVKGGTVSIKGSGFLYVEGTKDGSAINCNDFQVEADKTFTAYLINSKNAVKADATVSVSSGTFHIYDCVNAFKTDTTEDDPSVTHFITLTNSVNLYLHSVTTITLSDTVTNNANVTVI